MFWNAAWNKPRTIEVFIDNTYLETLRHAAHTPNVFVWRTTTGDPRDGSFEVRRHSLLHWTNGGLSYWAVSDAAPPELEAFRDAYMK